MLQAAIDRIAARRMLSLFRDSLRTREQRQKDIHKRMKPGALEFLKMLSNGHFPDTEELLRLLPVSFHLSKWGIYARAALPLVPGLPLLIYVGSSCCMSVPIGGMAKRAYTHLYRMSSQERT